MLDAVSHPESIGLIAALIGLAAGVAPVEKAKLPPFQVVRTGRAFGHGDSSPFPKKRTADVVFGEGFLFGETRGDGFFEVARSKDGRRLYTKIATDDGIESNAIFELKTEGVLPGDAVLQMVDGYVEVVPELDPGLGSPTVRSVDGKRFLKQHHEAWLAMPGQRLIVRPSTGVAYPLLPAVGRHDPVSAKRAQWVVYVGRCKEAQNRPCVYYGPPAASCARAVKAGEHEGILAFPNRCPSPR